MNSAELLPSSCDYCGLPLESVSTVAATPDYCCIGCRIAAEIAGASLEEGQNRWALTRLGLAIFFTMNVMVFTLALWSWDVYESDAALASPAGVVLFELFRYLSLLLSTAVLLMLGGPLLQNAAENLRRGVITTDLLIVLGVIAALGYSLISLFAGGTHTYFEVACMVLVGVTLGRWLEAVGKLKTTNAIRTLEKLLPADARLVEPGALGGLRSGHPPGTTVHERTVPLDSLEAGQWIRVLPGERFATDGRICRGQAAVDEQIVTGESAAAIKETGDDVFAGTLNLDGDLLVAVTAPARQGALLRIVDAVAQAATAKGRVQRAADQVSSWFVPGVILVALTTFVFHSLATGWGSGLMTALAVLLIACPCALGIATPLAIWTALGRASEMGVLFRHGDAISQLARTKAICFDKTGTLTTGGAHVDRLVISSETSREQLLLRALALASASTHGLSAAIREFAFDAVERTAIPLAEWVESRPGQGTVAQLDRQTSPIYLGSLSLMIESGLARSDSIQEAIAKAQRQGQPLACLGWDGHVRGVFSFRECLRDESKEVLESLRAAGYYVVVLTGDHSARAAACQQSLGIDVATGLLPEDKLAMLRRIRTKHGVVAMVGDGINDAPALAEADVGIALGCGADVTRDAATVCLLGDNLRQVEWSIELARRTMQKVRQNLFWAFAYNLVGIALAAAGWLNPMWAAVAMVGSSLFVIGNSLSLTSPPARQREASAPIAPADTAYSVTSNTIHPATGSAPSVS